MCRVNVTDFRNNISHYIDLCNYEEVSITKNGKVVAVLSNPDKKYYQALVSLCGCLNVDEKEDADDVIGEEIMKKCGF